MKNFHTQASFKTKPALENNSVDITEFEKYL